MSWIVLVHGLMPLITFVMVHRLFGSLKLAVWATASAAAAEFVAWWVLSGKPDYLSLIAATVLITMGAFAVKRQNPVYVKLQPAVMAILMTLGFAYFQFFTKGLAYMIGDLAVPLLGEDQGARFQNPEFLALFNYLITSSIVALVIYACWVAYAALRYSDTAWLLVRAFGMWVVFFGVALGASFLYPFIVGVEAVQGLPGLPVQ